MLDCNNCVFNYQSLGDIGGTHITISLALVASVTVGLTIAATFVVLRRLAKHRSRPR